MMLGELLGWVCAFCFGVCAIPQACRSVKCKNSHGMTWAFLLLWLFGEVFYLMATLVSFGPVGWMLANIIANTSCLMVIIFWKVFPEREENGPS